MCSSNSCISSGERFAASAMCAMYLEQSVLGAMCAMYLKQWSVLGGMLKLRLSHFNVNPKAL